MAGYLSLDTTVFSNLSLTGQLVGTLKDRGGAVYNALAYGVVGDGSADDTASFQSLVNSVPNGATVTAPSNATIRVSSTVSVIGKKINLFRLAFSEGAILAPVLWLTDVDGSSLVDLSCAGSETTVTTSGTTRNFVTITSSDRVFADRIVTTGKCSGVRLIDSNFCVVRNADLTSFVTNTTNANLCYAVSLHASSYNRIENPSATSAGGIAVNVQTGNFNRITGARGDILYDNGVYISSGNFCQIDGASVTNVRGDSGLKARGTGHRITGSAVSGAVVGITVTGNGVTPDNLNYNGFGTIVQGNSISKVSGYGIIIKDQDGFTPRHYVIDGNSLQSVGLLGGGFAPITVIAPAFGHRIVNNIVDGYESTYGYIIAGTSASTCSSIVMMGNTAMNGGEGYRIAFTEYSVFAGNTVTALTDVAFSVRSSNSNQFTNNALADYAIDLRSANKSIGNVISGNAASITGTLANNAISSYGTLNLAGNAARLSTRTLDASVVTVSAALTNVATNEVVFTVGGASGASLGIMSGGTFYFFNSAGSAKAT